MDKVKQASGEIKYVSLSSWAHLGGEEAEGKENGTGLAFYRTWEL